jgi:prepilin-type N-terminal cleavage/methylation domain-containing protein
MRNREKGFTLIELIMVIVLLGLLAAVAIPQYTNLQTEAQEAAELGVVGGVRSGIYTKYAANLAQGVTPAYPATLDANANGACVTCFTNVLSQGGINDSNWTKAGLVYTGPAGNSYTYNPATGEFV